MPVNVTLLIVRIRGRVLHFESIDVPVKEPWTSIVHGESDRDIVPSIAGVNDIANRLRWFRIFTNLRGGIMADRVNIVIRIASSTTDDLECVL